MAVLLAGTAAGLSYYYYPGKAAAPAADRLGPGAFAAPDLSGLLGQGQISAYTSVPTPLVTATATAGTPTAQPTPSPASPTPAPDPSATPASPPATNPAPPPSGPLTPLGGASYAGSLLLNESGSQLTSWNQTSTFCPETFWQVPDGTVGTDADGNATLTVNGQTGSCVAAISPGSYSSAVIEADIDFPALPGSSNTIADWTSLWLTDGNAWPQDGELDAVEAQPVNGLNAVSWHSGSSASQFVASTDDFFPTKLAQGAPNLTPGWHVVDIVYTQGFFAVYYDGQQYTSYTSSNVTGDPLNIYITTSVTPDISTIMEELGGPPVNSDNSPATIAVKYVRVWSYQ
jgi:hypothetical protein